jgi:hypothetical protein
MLNEAHIPPGFWNAIITASHLAPIQISIMYGHRAMVIRAAIVLRCDCGETLWIGPNSPKAGNEHLKKTKELIDSMANSLEPIWSAIRRTESATRAKSLCKLQFPRSERRLGSIFWARHSVAQTGCDQTVEIGSVRIDVRTKG